MHQLQHLALHEDVGVHRDDLLLEGADQLQTSAVTYVRQARVPVAAEVALKDLAFLGPVEERAPLLKLAHAVGRFLRVQLGHAIVVEELAPTHGVAEVDLPVVLGGHVAHGCGYAALGHHRVGLAQERLGDDADLQAALLGLDCGPQSGATGTDDQYVVVVVFV